MFRLADQHKTNYEYWRLILFTLNEEVKLGNVDARAAKVLRRQYIRLMRRNDRKYRKLLKVAEHTLERYHRVRGELSDG